MNKSNAIEVRGVIQAKAERPAIYSKPNVEFTVFDSTGQLVPVCYTYPTPTMAQTVWDSINVGNIIKFFIEDPTHSGRASHNGVGSISVLNQTLSREDFGFSERADTAAGFTPAETNALRQALNSAKAEIQKKFHPPNSQLHRVEERLDELAEQIGKTKKFDWAKLFVTCVVGISVDLGFGTTVPETLVNLFKNLMAGILEQKILPAPNK